MAKSRRQEQEWRPQRQGPSFCEERRSQLETAATRRRITARLILCKDEWHEKEADIRKDSERPEL